MNDHDHTEERNFQEQIKSQGAVLAGELRFGIESLHTHTYALLDKVEELVDLYTRSAKQ